MNDPPEPKSKAEAFARRAAERLERSHPDQTPLAGFDPIWITLFIAIVRVLLEYLSASGAEDQATELARLKAPRWWQWRSLARRRRLLTEARRRVEEIRASQPRSLSLARVVADDAMVAPAVDAVLDVALLATSEELTELDEELLS